MKSTMTERACHILVIAEFMNLLLVRFDPCWQRTVAASVALALLAIPLAILTTRSNP